jgi:Divergent InlB B-repeat domain
MLRPLGERGFGFFAFAHGVSATLRPDRTSTQVPVVVSECGPSGCGGLGGTNLGEFFEGGLGIFPTRPLTTNTLYRVTATGTVTDAPASTNYPFSISWCFSTGAGYIPSSDCSPPASRGGLEPIFVPETLNVTVSGKGSVSGPGVACPGACAHAYPSGRRVTLTARPAANQRFAGWTGSCAGSGPACALVLRSNAAAGARFALTAPPSLSHSHLSFGHRPSLAFSAGVSAGATPLRTIAVSAPRGVSFADKTKTLAKGIVIKVGGRRVRLSVTGGGHSVRIKLAQVAASASVAFGKPALLIARSLARQVKHHRLRSALSFTVHLTDQGGRTTKVVLRFRFH